MAMRPSEALFLLLLAPAISIAAADAPAPSADLNGELLRVTLTLIGIVVLILAAGWLTRRLQLFSRPSRRRLRCIESLPVGVKERILLVDIDGTQLLIGIAPGSIRTLHMLANPTDETVTAIKPPREFRQTLHAVATKGESS